MLTVQSPIHHYVCTLSMRGIHACFSRFLDMNAFLGKEAHRMQNSDHPQVRDINSNKFSIISVQKQGYILVISNLESDADEED